MTRRVHGIANRSEKCKSVCKRSAFYDVNWAVKRFVIPNRVYGEGSHDCLTKSGQM